MIVTKKEVRSVKVGVLLDIGQADVTRPKRTPNGRKRNGSWMGQATYGTTFLLEFEGDEERRHRIWRFRLHLNAQQFRRPRGIIGQIFTCQANFTVSKIVIRKSKASDGAIC